MIILKIEKLKRFQKCLLNNQKFSTNMRNLFLLLSFCFVSFSIHSQKNSLLKPIKVGFLYNYGNERNFIFDDLDYYYTTTTFKAQAFYQLGTWKSFNLELIVQPQVQQLRHQLLNEQFVTPEEENYLEKRERFTKLKTMRLYAFELGFSAKKEISKKLDFNITIGLGLASIDTETERLAKGFTFIENGSLGFSYKTSNTTTLYLGTNFGHISNLNFKSPNDGYNILGIEVGVSYKLKSYFPKVQ